MATNTFLDSSAQSTPEEKEEERNGARSATSFPQHLISEKTEATAAAAPPASSAPPLSSGRGGRGVRLLFFILPTFILLSLLLYFLFRPAPYTRMLPEGAKAIVRLDARALNESGCTLPKALTDIVGKDLSGIDATKPLYAFVTPNEYIGLLAAVDSRDALEALATRLVTRHLSDAPETIEGRTWLWLRAGWLMAWDERRLLVLGPAVQSEADALRQTMTALFEGRGRSFARTDAFDRLEEQSGPLALYATLDALPTPYNLLLRLDLPPAVDPATVALFASSQMERQKDGSFALSFQMEKASENDDILRAIDAHERSKGCIGRIAEAEDDTLLLRMATAGNGAELVRTLQQDATTRGLLLALNQTIDATRMLSSCCGAVNLDIVSIDKNWQPAFALTAQTRAADLFKDADYWMESAKKQNDVQLVRTAPDAFRLETASGNLCFGNDAQHGHLYFCSPTLTARATAAPAFGLSKSKDALLTYVRLNTKTLLRQPPLAEGTAAASLVGTLLPAASAITYEAHQGRHARLTIN